MSDAKTSISWDEVVKYSRCLVVDCVEDGFAPNYIYGIVRGGVIPARIIQEYLWGGQGEATTPFLLFKKREVIDVLREGEWRLLIVDEIIDTGRQMVALFNKFRERGIGQEKLDRDVRVACLHWIRDAKFKPDYYATSEDHKGSWIVYPWEIEQLPLIGT